MRHPIVRFVVLLLVFTSTSAARAQSSATGFAESFALSLDRGRVLDQLIPGSEDYYYYHCLHRQNVGAFAEVTPLLQTWVHRHGRGPRVEEIENRQALLTFPTNPRGTYEFLRERLHLRFDAERKSAGARPDLPMRLDPELLSPATLTRRALDAHPGTVDGFRERAFDALARSDLTDDLLMSFLKRLERPDVPNLPALIVRNLSHRQSRGFGSLAIHRNLLLEQLEELVRLQPSLLDETQFVDVYLRRLAPSPDVQWQHDPAARQAYLERLWAFAQRLRPAYDPLKAHVLYHRLVHDLALGTPDKARLVEYLRLPRQTRYVNPDYLRRRPSAEVVVDTNRDFTLGFKAIGDDEPLVRAYLQHFFASEDSYQPYLETVQEAWVRRLFAETKILLGTGDMEKWYSLLDDPAYYEQLKERVEIGFAPTQRVAFGANDPVSIDVDLKNVDKLLVKVFVIDTFDFEREESKEVDASINLDGMVANEEQTYSYTDNPLRRVRRHFDFPSLVQPGTYVVDFLGNGLSSRAVIRKGRLQYVSRIGSAGHVLSVLDEQGQLVRDATIWCGGQEYRPDARGTLTIPFAPERVQQPIILRQGALTSLERFDHLDEKYSLAARVFVDREALLASHKAKILVRPTLTVQGMPIDLSLLENAELSIAAKDLDGVESSLTARDLTLTSDAEWVHEIAVPERLVSLSVSLRGKVKSLSRGASVDVASTPARFELSGIESTPDTRCSLLGRSSDGYFLEVRGKSGEAQPEQAVHVTLQHESFTDPIEVDFKTDAQGRIRLGALPGVVSVAASSLPKGAAWRLRDAARTYADALGGVAGKVLRVPYQGRATGTDRAAVSLLEVVGGAFVRDAFDHVAITGGFVELRDLAAGDYDLWLKEADEHVLVRVTAGAERAGYAVGRDRKFELSGKAPLQIQSVAVSGEELRVEIVNASAQARVHVFATRYLEPYDPFERLQARLRPARPDVSVVHPESTYDAGRAIGDEYRYVLERRYQKKYPGNLLRRPGLILNPWDLAEAKTGAGTEGAAGGAFAGRRGGRAGRADGGRRAEGAVGLGATIPPGTFANVDFLPTPAPTLVNLRPDAQGILRVPLADLGPGQLVHVIALDDRDTVYSTLALPEKPLAPRGRTLEAGLDPSRHFTEQRRIEFVAAGARTTVDDVTTSSLEAFDSLAKVFALLQTLSGNSDLDAFAFVVRWPKLPPEEQAKLYSEHACHELHFFLYMKDRAFFDRVVKPYLANKAHKTFLDRWLLDDDLAGYLEPWAFAQLNVVERILLTRRLPAQRDAGARYVRELSDLEPADPDRDSRLFAAVLAGRALDVGRYGSADFLSGKPPRGQVPATGRAPSDPTPVQARENANKAKDEKAEAAPAAEEPELVDADEAARERTEDLEKRGKLREIYRAPGRTHEFAESNYWHRPIADQNAALIPVNRFWRDYALSAAGTPFCSPHVAEASRNLSEMMMALAVLDLPFEANAPTTERAGNRLTLEAQTPLLLVRKEILASEAGKAESPILISQNFYRLDDRFRFDGNERLDNFVSGEFLVDVAYGCQVVLTNPTSTPRKLDLLLQIPRGAVPVQNGFMTRGGSVQMQPFATMSSEYAFYFPSPGDFAHYPAHVAKDGALVAFAAPVTLHVVVAPSAVDSTSWDHVSQDAAPEAVLAFLDRENLSRLDLGKIAWRLRDAVFFRTVIDKLRQRFRYDDLLWSYGLLHGDESATREYLRHADAFLTQCGRALDSRLVTIDAVERRSYQLIEFDPLFNARAHRFGRQRRIPNLDLAAQYATLLGILCYQPRLDDADWMTMTYHLLLQDRIEEALATFGRVDPTKLRMRIQYDYMRCYLDFFTDEHRIARGIAEPYRNHPVERWRTAFRDVLNQLDEADGEAAATSNPDERTQRQTQLAATEPALDLGVEARRVVIRYRNLTECEVSYYGLDVEFSFSTNPFVEKASGSFAYIKPNRSDVVSLPSGMKELTFDLPQEFQQANVLVEARGGGITRRQPYLANTLAVQTIESYGQLQVVQAQTGKALPSVYVKVYARLPNDTVRFHKDGYTDLRGRFDYASVSESGSEDAQRFAILVLSDSNGAVIREVAPPGK